MKIYKVLLFVLIAIASISCKEDELDVYTEDDQVYFYYALPSEYLHEIRYNDIPTSSYTLFNFGLDLYPKEDTVLQIPMALMGKLVDYDRPISCTLAEGSTAVIDRDIEFLPSYINANEHFGYLNIKLKSTKALDDGGVLAKIKIISNEHLKASYADSVKITDGKQLNIDYYVYVENITGMPNIWADPTWGPRISMVFGDYSAGKFRMMCDACGFDLAYFTYDETRSATTVGSLIMQMGFSYARMCNNYLRNYKEANGKDMVDENGEVITMGKSYTNYY